MLGETRDPREGAGAQDATWSPCLCLGAKENGWPDWCAVYLGLSMAEGLCSNPSAHHKSEL